MKLASWWPQKDQKVSANDFVLSPYLAVRSLYLHHNKDQSTAIRFVLFLYLTTLWIVLFRKIPGPLSTFEIMLFSPAIYFFTETIGAFGQLIFFRKKTYPIHRHPLKATTLSHFWGRDWNIWVQDWLREITRSTRRRKHHQRIIVIFFLSGFFHELMCNLPYWVMYRKSYFGTMIAYFLIQGLLLWIDKKMISQLHPVYRRIYLWLAVILPSPLFINVPLLTFFGLTHE